MAIARKGIVGLDLGHHRLKAVQVERTSSGWKVTRFGSIPTPPDCLKDGVAVDGMVLSAAIKQLLKEARISATVAHIAAAGGSVFVRPVQFPKMNEVALRKSIRFEAGRYVPGSVEESFIEFEILGDAAEGQMNVLMVAAPRDVVESRVNACEAAGLDVEVVDVESFAINRALIETNREGAPASSFALIDIGASSTSVSIIHDGVFAMNRSIPHGGQILTEALVSYFSLSEEDAEAGKTQLDVTNLLNEIGVLESPPLKVIQPHIDDLVREVRRSLNYFQSQQGEGQEARKVEHLVVCGGGAKLPGLPEYLSQRLGLPVTARGVYENPLILPCDMEEGDTGLDLAIACGLALRDQIQGALPKAAEPKPKKTKPEKPAKPEKAKKSNKKKAAEPVAEEPAEPLEVLEPAAQAEPAKPAKKEKKGFGFGNKPKAQPSPEQATEALPEPIAEPEPVLAEAPVEAVAEPAAEPKKRGWNPFAKKAKPVEEAAPKPKKAGFFSRFGKKAKAAPVEVEEAPVAEMLAIEPMAEEIPVPEEVIEPVIEAIAEPEPEPILEVPAPAPAPTAAELQEPVNLVSADDIASLLNAEPVYEAEPAAPVPAPAPVAKEVEPQAPVNLVSADDIAALLTAEATSTEGDQIATPPSPAAEVEELVAQVAPPLPEEPTAISEPPLTNEVEDLVAQIGVSKQETPPEPVVPVDSNSWQLNDLVNEILSSTPDKEPLDLTNPVATPTFEADEEVTETHAPPPQVMNAIEALLAEIAEPGQRKAKAQAPAPEPEAAPEPTPEPEPIAEAQPAVEPESEPEAPAEESPAPKKKGRSRKAA